MRSLGAIAIIAFGAILAFAISDVFKGIDLTMIGYIIMAAGVVGLVIGLMADMRDRKPLTAEREVVETPGGYKERVSNH